VVDDLTTTVVAGYVYVPGVAATCSMGVGTVQGASEVLLELDDDVDV